MKIFYYLIMGVTLASFNSVRAQTASSEIKISGAMSNVMKKGQLQGTILLDTIQNKKGLYGIGPKEYLKGELLIIDGESYVSSMDSNGSIKMEQTFDVKAPFFVYSNNDNWCEYTLPAHVKNIKDLENFIDELSVTSIRPFVFKLEGIFSKVKFHIQNLPDGTVVKSPKDAHTGQGKYESDNVLGELVGFFSTEHQAIFTHHDSFIHIHYINADRSEMGHVDEIFFDSGNPVRLYIQK